MSLTAFLKIKRIRDEFRRTFKKPRMVLDAELLAEPMTNHYGLVGTAFDYLLRFYIKRLNPGAVDTEWVSEKFVKTLIPNLPDIDKDEFLRATEQMNPLLSNPRTKDLFDVVEFAREVYRNYLQSGEMTRDVYEAAILLAHIDIIYRTGQIYDDFGKIDERDIKDLQNLISIVNPKHFKCHGTCILNPEFGKASVLVGGADCDLIMDDAIIDIKTTKILDFKRKYFNQLIGYYILYRIGGIDGANAEIKINKIGIYFARHAYMVKINIDDIAPQDVFDNFTKWFKEQAVKEYEHNKFLGIFE